MERGRIIDPQHIILTNARLAGVDPEVILGRSRESSVVTVRGEIQAQLREKVLVLQK